MLTTPDPSRPRLGDRNPVRGLVGVTGATMVANGLGYLLTLCAARWLGPDEFGVFAALMSALVVGNVVALGVQATTARTIARCDATNAPHPADLTAFANVGCAVTLVVGVALAWPLSNYLRLDSPFAVLSVALALLPITWLSYLQGRAQGSESYGTLSTLLVLGATGKIVGAVAGMVAGGALNAMIGLGVGSLVAAALASLGTHHRPRLGADFGAHLVELMHATHALFAFFVLANVDVLLARHFLAPSAAGTYALGAVIAKVAFWLPQSVGLVAFPRFVDPARREGTIRLGAGIVGGVGIVTVAGAFLLGGRLAALLGGAGYGSLAGVAGMFAAIGSSLALVHLLLLDRIAQEDRVVVIAVWTAVLSMVVTVSVVTHQSVEAIAATTLAATLSLAIMSLLMLGSASREVAPATSGRPASR